MSGAKIETAAKAAMKAAVRASTSRTNKTAAAAIAGAVAVAVARRAGFDLTAALAEHGLEISDVMAVLATAAGSLVIYFREQTQRVKDEQDDVTPRP